MADSFDLLKNIRNNKNSEEETSIVEKNEETTPREEVLITEEIKETAPQKKASIVEEVEEEEEDEATSSDSDNLNIFDPRERLGKKYYALTIVLLTLTGFNIKFFLDIFKVFNNDIAYFIIDFAFLALNIIATIKRLRDVQWSLWLAIACVLPVHFSLSFNILLMVVPLNLKNLKKLIRGH